MTSSPERSTEWHGVVLVMIGAVCFSTAILFTRLTEGLGTQTIVFYRALFGLSFLSLFTLRQREPLRFRIYQHLIPRLVLLGIIVSLTVMLYTYAIQHTTAANAVLLVNSAPVYVAVLAPLVLHEAVARYTRLSLVLALGGMACVSDPANLELRWDALDGIAAAALSGFTYALAMLTSRGLRGKITGLTQNLWCLLITGLVTLPWAFAPAPDTLIANVPVLVPLGILSLGLSYLFYFMGLQRTRAQIVSVVSLFEPVSGILIGILFFAEIPNPLGWVGAGLLLISML
ncbi:MAG: EamA family transporter, partial [Chloroflexi bacterium]|nr:EamA family transporter [Chloroflexota bacterium]